MDNRVAAPGSDPRYVTRGQGDREGRMASPRRPGSPRLKQAGLLALGLIVVVGMLLWFVLPWLMMEPTPGQQRVQDPVETRSQ
jgi:hypothetical protein